MKSGVYKIYTRTGAAQFSLLPPRRDPERGFITKEGAVLLQAARCFGQGDDGNYRADWENKIKFAIGINDIAEIMAMQNQVKIQHVFGNLMKSVTFRASSSGMVTLKVLEESVEGWQHDAAKGIRGRDPVQLELNQAQWGMLNRLLVGCTPALIGWE